MVTSDCLSALCYVPEGVIRGCLLCLGMGSDPGGHRNWPFDPGLSQHTPMHLKLLSVPNLLFSPIWGATDSLLLLPAQSGLTKFLHYPHPLDIRILHPAQGVLGDYFIWGKVGSGPGEQRYTPFDPGSLHYQFGQVPPIWGPLTVLRWRPLRMGGCSPTVAPRGVYIHRLTPVRGNTGTWFKRWLPLSASSSTNLTQTLPNHSHPTCIMHSSVCRL